MMTETVFFMGSRLQLVLLVTLAVSAVAQTEPPATTATLPAQPAAPKPQTEMSQKDEPALFKARVNLVQVPVVVRDRAGKAIGSLKKEDFQLFDKGKAQYIARFSMETATGRLLGAVEAKKQDTGPDRP